jgi:hypothetical protein
MSTTHNIFPFKKKNPNLADIILFINNQKMPEPKQTAYGVCITIAGKVIGTIPFVIKEEAITLQTKIHDYIKKEYIINSSVTINEFTLL